MAKQPRDLDDLRRQLYEQIGFLIRSAKAYDEGEYAEAKRMATILRLLFHETRKSKSLLGQLRLREIEWLDTASKYDPENQASYVGLLSIKFEAGRIPWLTPHGTPEQSSKIDFNKWWSHPIIVAVATAEKTFFSRQNIILNVADTDGGAHVDPELEEIYQELSRKNSVGYTAIVNGKKYPMLYPELPCLRQVSHEVLLTLQEIIPQVYPSHYPAVIPTTPYGVSIEHAEGGDVGVEIYFRERGV